MQNLVAGAGAGSGTAMAAASCTCAWPGARLGRNGSRGHTCNLAQRPAGVRLVPELKGTPLAGASATRTSSNVPLQIQVRAAQTASRDVGTAAEPVLHETQPLVELKGKVVLSRKNIGILVDIPAFVLDNYAELFQERRIELELVSVELDPKTNRPKVSRSTTIEGWAKSTEIVLSGDREFGVSFTVPPDFGEPGAIFVRNHHPREFLLVSLTIEKPDKSVIEFPCNSWVYNTSKYSSDRVFFSNKACLPEDTPAGLRALRDQELRTLQGDGTGERKEWDRVYDYDVYDDLGNPDWTWDGKRPTLGGRERPYPRRMRTGRSRAFFDLKAERVVNMFTGDLQTGLDPLGNYYIPRDEKYARIKYTTTLLGSVWGMVHGIVPLVQSFFTSKPNEYRSFQDIRDTYEESAEKGGKSLFKYPLPHVAHASDLACLEDEEFARQTVAGFSPVVIERAREYPPKGVTALTNAHIEPYLEGLTVEEALESKRLFKVDYHNLFMPFVERINKQDRKTYATRIFLFLTGEGKLKPIAIELALPRAPEGVKEAIRVFTPPQPGQGKNWFWELAKLHASSIDFTYHELITHWLQTHATMEPLIIASHRNLSAMHPIKVLLAPHLINTLHANSSARQILVSAGGYIELFFIPGRACTMELSAAGYPAWQFDLQALPADLIARGMAEPAPGQGLPGDVRLVVEDYPYAKDGLELWDALRGWVRRCVELAYPDDAAVRNDAELQAWYRDIRERGHGDHAGAAWWPPLDNRADAVHVVSIVAWIASGRHSGVHYGQFPYAGYVLNRPCFMRLLVPEEGSDDARALLEDPEQWVLKSLASRFHNWATTTGAEVLSTHPTDEEYMGTRNRGNWTSDPAVLAAFAEFGEELRALEQRIAERNADPTLHHRSGPARMPYNMLVPSSGPGITARGVPYSMCA